MRTSRLIRQSLFYFWRTELAVVLGVGVAVGVLAGALLVGDSVRESLRNLFLSRLGATSLTVTANRFFRSELASDLRAHPAFDDDFQESVSLIAFEGMVSHAESGRRRSRVQVYGVDEAFWQFHGATAPDLSGREVLLTRALAEELGAAAGDSILLRVEKPSSVSAGSLHGQKDDRGRTLRLQLTEGLSETGLPEFSLYPDQGELYAAFVPLSRLQRDLDLGSGVNVVLISGVTDSPEPAMKLLEDVATLEDFGLKLRALPERRSIAVESDAILVSRLQAEAVREAAFSLGVRTKSIFTYLVNRLAVGEREIPYSLVTALDRAGLEELFPEAELLDNQSLLLNDWAARELQAGRDDRVSMTYFLWRDEGRLLTETAEFDVTGVVSIEGLASDRELAPEFPGISETEHLSDWDPPFPIDFSAIRDQDEAYWDRYRTTPKAFILLDRAQSIWPVRQGQLTSIRLRAPEGVDIESLADDVTVELVERLRLVDSGFSIVASRRAGLEASRGATDFGEYFVYFSYFLMMAALLLTGLFFKLGIEQRSREIGTLQAMGFPAGRIRRLFLTEGALLATIGGLIGVGVAIGYASAVMLGLRTWWVDAVGTRLLELVVTPLSLTGGVLGGILVALVAIWLSLRGLKQFTARSLLTGSFDSSPTPAPKRLGRARMIAWGALASSLLLAVLSAAGVLSDVAGFFGAGNLLLLSLLTFQWIWLGAGSKWGVEGTGAAAIVRLGLRNATHRPGRSLVAIALIAFATFTIVSVDAFRKNDGDESGWHDRGSGSGGYPLVAESLLPLHWDPDTNEGREALNLPYLNEPEGRDLRFQTFRLRPGEDASCLNLYRPQNPRILAAGRDFLLEGRFRFAASQAVTDAERENPWLLLEKQDDDGAVPVIGDANSMAYVLHLGLGETFLLPRAGGAPLRLKLVATLADSLFQSELLLSEKNFLAQFPDNDGFRYFLIDAPPAGLDATTRLLEQRLTDFGLDVESTAAKLAGFHRVENTYLSTFQSLGGLGLVLGTFGLAAILLRNVLERRRELALLRAIGYRGKDFSLMIFAENALLLFFGLLTGIVTAVLAIAPALSSRGGNVGSGSLLLLLLAVLASGLLSSLAAVAAVHRAPLLQTVRADV